MKTILMKGFAWICQGGWKRILWEVLCAAFFAAVVWGVTELLDRTVGKKKVDEGQLQEMEWKVQQAEIDRIEYEGMLEDRDKQIGEQDEEISRLNEKIASDSIKRLSDSDAIRTINGYIKKGSGRPERRPPGLDKPG